MEVIIGKRQSGKTTKLIRIAAEKGLYIVVANHAEARHCVELALKLGCTIPFPLTFHEFLRGDFGPIKGFVIDDVSLLFAQLARGKLVHAITIDSTDEILIKDM